MQLPHQTNSKNLIYLLLADSVAVFLAFLAALTLRFDGWIPAGYGRSFFTIIPLIIVLYCLVNYMFKLYAHLWRYTGAQEVTTIFGSAATSTTLLAALMLVQNGRPLPLSVIILGGLFAAGAFTAVRYRNRLFTGFMARLQRVVGSPNRCRVLIIGAGESGQFLARQMKTGRQSYLYELVGFIDDDDQKQGMRLHGVSILGTRQAIPALVASRGVSLIVIAIHNISGPDMRNILSLTMGTDAKVKMLPDFLGAMDSARNTSLLKDITPVDLLGRQPYQIDQAACGQLLADKVVLVTGAAGSIGSELCRQILTFKPRQLLLLDNNETGLYDLMVNLAHCQSAANQVKYQVVKDQTPHTPLIADIRDKTKVDCIFKRYRPHIVFHAAAYKHVPLMEQQPEEAISVNVLGTKIVSRAATRYGTEKFVLISTDKAINPSSVMGATKRLAEMMLTHGQPAVAKEKGVVKPAGRNGNHAATLPGSSLHASAIQFTVVRFGNVLDSRGSVVPTFTRQIEMGGPLTITHPEMTRYFITIPEAVSLVIQAATLTHGGDIFMLDMGQEIRIMDLAHKMIRLRGLRPDDDIAIEIIGVRPGEKLREELLGAGETRLRTAHPKIYRIQPTSQPSHKTPLTTQIAHLAELIRTQQRDEMMALLWQLVKTDTEVVARLQWN